MSASLAAFAALSGICGRVQCGAMKPSACASLLFVAIVAACGGAPPAAAPAAPSPKPDAAAPAPASGAAGGLDAAAVEQCLAAAGAKRARFSGEPVKISVKHVLVKYKGAKNAGDSIARSREEACLRAIEVRDKIREGTDFDEMVKQYSDEAGAATRGGSLGAVERAELAKPFADAAFELSVNQVSDVVETESGFHVIFRTE
jgi:NIMA-interacting peptidyl-prolyl cis-trans isomerase 1